LAPADFIGWERSWGIDSLASQLAPRLAPLTRESEIQAVL
jgi:hypothetical protein